MFCLSIVRKPFTRSSPPVAPKPSVTDFAPKESFRTEIPLKARWYQRKHITVYVYRSINVYIYMYVFAFVFYVHTDAKISKHTDRRRQDALSSRIFRNPLEIQPCRFDIKKTIKLMFFCPSRGTPLPGHRRHLHRNPPDRFCTQWFVSHRNSAQGQLVPTETYYYICK
jgi:hypothetical protein